jgi:hypothetical protein
VRGMDDLTDARRSGRRHHAAHRRTSGLGKAERETVAILVRTAVDRVDELDGRSAFGWVRCSRGREGFGDRDLRDRLGRRSRRSVGPAKARCAVPATDITSRTAANAAAIIR